MTLAIAALSSHAAGSLCQSPCESSEIRPANAAERAFRQYLAVYTRGELFPAHRLISRIYIAYNFILGIGNTGAQKARCTERH